MGWTRMGVPRWLMRIAGGLLCVCGMTACRPGPREATPAESATPDEYVFGLLLVGPYNDQGWSQAHYDAGQYVERRLPGTRMVYVDKVNPADRPGTTPAQLAEMLRDQGARLVIFNSDDMKDGAVEFARAHPEVPVLHASGDNAWPEGRDYKALPNLANVMGRMEYGEMIAGCAAALVTRTGRIGFLGPLINDETRRLAAATYLGARHAWTQYRHRDPSELRFKVVWIGFWFNLPGVTADPSQVADDFFNTGYDVVLSGIDTTEALVQAQKQRLSGKTVWAVPYDYIHACREAPDACLGVPFFNWGPEYVRQIQAARAGTWQPSFRWLPPDWADLNGLDTTALGFQPGPALPDDAAQTTGRFIQELKNGLALWQGPLNYQDGTLFLPAGTTASEQQIWYLPQLLEGMEGQSVSR